VADDEFLEVVGKTALGVAMVRAGESRRSDRLFDDPHAAAFIAAAPHAFDDEQRVAGRMLAASSASSWGVTFAAHAVLRTRFFDDYLLDATAGGIRQVVLLGAGLDTRAFRLAWPDGLHVYELDLPDVLDFKDRVLTEQAAKPACGRHVVAADLREGITGPLMRAGLSAAARTAWLWKGC
jgi:methyltransferase (TIGR00027 family)